MNLISKVWDKIEPINNVSAEEFIRENNIKEDEDVVLICYPSGRVWTLDKVGSIIDVYGLDTNLTSEEVSQKYLEILIKQNEESKKEELSLKEAHDKISILNEQNSKLLLDKAKNEIQINTLNKNLANVTLEVAKMKGGM